MSLLTKNNQTKALNIGVRLENLSKKQLKLTTAGIVKVSFLYILVRYLLVDHVVVGWKYSQLLVSRI